MLSQPPALWTIFHSALDRLPRSTFYGYFWFFFFTDKAQTYGGVWARKKYCDAEIKTFACAINFVDRKKNTAQRESNSSFPLFLDTRLECCPYHYDYCAPHWVGCGGSSFGFGASSYRIHSARASSEQVRQLSNQKRARMMTVATRWRGTRDDGDAAT